MKRTASSAKEITHERIVEAAARAIRRSGYDGTSVADIMKEAGLTHGGCYAHFDSREAMLAEAADRAGAKLWPPRRASRLVRRRSRRCSACCAPISRRNT